MAEEKGRREMQVEEDEDSDGKIFATIGVFYRRD